MLRTSSLLASGLALLLASVLPASAQGGGAAVTRWRLPSRTLQPADRVGERLFGRAGDEIVAIDIKTGKKLWGTRIGNLRPGARVVGADAKAVYALGETGLYVLALDSGAIMHTQALKRPRELMLASGSIYVALNRGVVRFASGGRKRLAKSKRFTGMLRGAAGRHVLLYRDLRGQRRPKGKLRGSPERLTVVDLKKNKKVYEFRLIRGGGHHVVRFTQDRLAFLDYSRQKTGKGEKKLFFTEVDYRANKKLRDLSLKHHYGAAIADVFHGRAVGDNGLILAQTGPGCGPKAPSKLLYLDLDEKTVRWTISRPAPLGVPLRRGGQVWASVGGATPRLLAVELDNGKVARELRLASPAASTLRRGVGDALLLRDAKGLVALSTTATAKVAPASKPTAHTQKGWRRYRDTIAGYVIELPEAWRLNPKHVRHFGRGAFAVPFVRYEITGGRWRFLASIHVLVRPARGQTIDQLWRAVLAQRRARAGVVKVLDVTRKTRANVPHLDGRYSFKNRFHTTEIARSLCVVSHGVAFELRARVRSKAKAVEAEISKIFARFRVRSDLKRARP